MVVEDNSVRELHTPYRRVVSLPFSEHKYILMVVDGLLVLIALLLALRLGAWQSAWDFSFGLIFDYAFGFVAILAMYLFLATANDAYRPRVASDPTASFVAIMLTVFQILLIYMVIYALLPPWTLARHFMGYFTLIAPIMLLIWRRVYSQVFVAAFKRRAIVVGAGWAGKTIARTIADFAVHHFELVGMVDDDPAKQSTAIDGVPVLGPVSALAELAGQKRVSDVVLAINRDVPGHVLSAMIECYERGIRVSTMPDLYEHLTDRVPVEHVGDNWFVVLPFSNRGQNLTFRVMKRLYDFTISLAGLLAFGLLLPGLALLIYLDSPGPIFYRQIRVGRGGKLFELVKLRSMVVNAERQGEAVWADKHDARVTRMGRFLRKTRLDEVPQLLNVLRGEMSLIGPRPERPEFMARLQADIPFYRTRLTVKPGLTGWAQVNYDYGRTVVDALEKLRYDLYYIKHQSIQLDLIITLKTLTTILMMKGI
jgi:exopolysaccharide biosynthesis polyprenyl glycosylphosphotransferase